MQCESWVTGKKDVAKNLAAFGRARFRPKRRRFFHCLGRGACENDGIVRPLLFHNVVQFEGETSPRECGRPPSADLPNRPGGRAISNRLGRKGL